MLIGRDFVFLHMPKTGGGTIGRLLREVLPDEYLRDGPHPYVHPGWQLIPAEAADLPVFCHARNPWDWYVSWYCFSSGGTPRSAKLWQSAFADGPDFRAFLDRACHGRLDHDRPELVRLMRAGMDFYTARWTLLVGGLNDQQLTVGRFERLFEDLEGFLRRVGAPIPDDFAHRAKEIPGVHVGKRGPYRDYYDDDTRELVGRGAAYFVERFGYRF